jgi:magnesium chelatase subunit D
MMSLSCAALNPGLRSILLLDAPHSGLQQLADTLAQLLRASSALPVKQHRFGTQAADDDIWGSLYLPSHHSERAVHRLFSAERNAKELQLITIADLTTLSLDAARAVTVLVGAEVVHLERNGISSCWHPQQCWLAGCASEAIGRLSPHMLDRFALRLSWQELVPTDADDDASAIARLLARVPTEKAAVSETLPSSDLEIQPETLPRSIGELPRLPLRGHLAERKYLEQVKQAAQRQVEVSSTALARILDYLPAQNYYPRREIALVRFAATLARLAGDAALNASHIDKAAQVLGFSRKQELPQRDTKAAEFPAFPDDHMEEEPVQPAPISTTSPTELQTEIAQPMTVQLPEAIHTTVIDSGTICRQPYPEDEAPPEREEYALKLPPTRYASSRSAHGVITGTDESDTLYDLALVSTILAAARFQKVRQDRYQRIHQHPYPGLLIERMDLRRYRRSQPIEQMFMLLFDYTSIREKHNWEQALLPYLHAAYTVRAAVTIIKVGAGDALSPLRAEVVRAKNILVPRVGLALEAGRGRATPLAHGLSLALEQLQRVLQHGRNITHKVSFVVISDGRGNVPLEMSVRDERETLVSREGIDDALHEARKIRMLKHVETVVLNPQPDYYPDLPERLAEALGATLVPIPIEEKTPLEQVLELEVMP